MKISIVIPIKNRKENIDKSIKSILNQTFQDYEIVLIDYGGNDNAKEIIDNIGDNRIKYFYVDEDGWNESRAKNIGIRKAKAEWIICMNADITLKENALNNCYKYFILYGKDYFYQSQRLDILENGEIDIVPEGFAVGDFQAGHISMWSKVRGYYEKLNGCGWLDMNLAKRTLKAGYKHIWMTLDVVNYHNWHGEVNRDLQYINGIKSLLNSSYAPNGEDWGSDKPIKKRKKTLIEKKIILFLSLIPVYLIIKPMRFTRISAPIQRIIEKI